MNSNEDKKTKKNGNETTTLEKLMESIMSEKVPDSEDIEDLSKNVGSLDDVVKLVEK